MTYRCSNIQWDTSNDDEQTEADDSLPETLDITFTAEEMDDITDVEDALSDAITEKTGFCHNGFQFEELE